VIDLASESLITFAQAAKLRPPSRGGRPTHVSTICRWATRGIRGVKLEVIRLGCVTYTSREAMQRFAEALTLETPRPPPGRVAERAEAALDAIGL
jgi:hypothetical protein